MKVETIKCDVCGKVKGESNKWLRLYIREGLKPFTCVTRPDVHVSFDAPSFYVPTLREVKDDPIFTQDICSDICLYKRLGQVLTLIRDEHTTTTEYKQIEHKITMTPNADGSGRYICACGWQSSIDMKDAYDKNFCGNLEAQAHLDQANASKLAHDRVCPCIPPTIWHLSTSWQCQCGKEWTVDELRAHGTRVGALATQIDLKE